MKRHRLVPELPHQEGFPGKSQPRPGLFSPHTSDGGGRLARVMGHDPHGEAWRRLQGLLSGRPLRIDAAGHERLGEQALREGRPELALEHLRAARILREEAPPEGGAAGSTSSRANPPLTGQSENNGKPYLSFAGRPGSCGA